MMPAPALWNPRSGGRSGRSKKRRKKGSLYSGLSFTGMVPRTAMFTTPGTTFVRIGAKLWTASVPAVDFKDMAVVGTTQAEMLKAAITRAAGARNRDFMRRFTS